VAITGGHAPAQAPEQLDLFMPSAAHRYTERPESVRNVPPDPECDAITVSLVFEDAECEPAGCEPDVCDTALPHAAASSPAATGTPSLTRPGTRASRDLLMFTISFGIFFPSLGTGEEPKEIGNKTGKMS
jgi:hypothetical protein